MVRALLRARPPRAPKPPAQTRGGSFEREPSHSCIFQRIWNKLFPAEVTYADETNRVRKSAFFRRLMLVSARIPSLGKTDARAVCCVLLPKF